MTRILTVAVTAVAAALALALPAVAATPTYKGTVGPGFTIKLASKPTKAGKIKLVVSDKSSQHNFHLSGPGVNVKTSVGETGTKTFTVTLKKGTYKFVCDPHKSFMQRSAERVFARAAREAPGNAEAQVAAAVGRFDKARPAEAFSRLGPLTRRFPDRATVRFHLGLLLLWSGEVKEARTQLVRATTVEPGSPLAREAQKYLDTLDKARV